MSLLPSGLEEAVSSEESLARMILSSGHFAPSTGRIKHPAFLPAPDNETSVFRADTLSPQDLTQHGALAATGRTLYGAAIVNASMVRRAGLEVKSKEPPPHHANLTKWPVDTDPEMQKARRKVVATELAEDAQWRNLE